MIRINEDWVIDVDPFNYTIKKDLHKQIKQKGGNVVDLFNVVGYYGTLDAAFNALGEQIIKDKLSTACYTLTEAVTALKECRKEFNELIKQIDEMKDG